MEHPTTKVGPNADTDDDSTEHELSAFRGYRKIDTDGDNA